mmetsp:Transcript_6449/g.17986  ORF Transcript_6449/g.17986 Transcript_6449/m.17986 type:complete len:422 (+) Transcript_6449:110-1375(+)
MRTVSTHPYARQVSNSVQRGKFRKHVRSRIFKLLLHQVQTSLPSSLAGPFPSNQGLSRTLQRIWPPHDHAVPVRLLDACLLCEPSASIPHASSVILYEARRSASSNEVCNMHVQALYKEHCSKVIAPASLESRDRERVLHRQCPRLLFQILRFKNREDVREQLRKIVHIGVPKRNEVWISHVSTVHEIVTDLIQRLLFRSVVILPVVIDVQVHLCADHAVRNSVLVELHSQLHLRLGESTSCHDHHSVEVAEPHLCDVRLQREGLCASPRKVPKPRSSFIGEGVHGHLEGCLVDAHWSPAFRARLQPSQLVDEQRLTHSRMSDNANVDGALNPLKPTRWRVVPASIIAQALLLEYFRKCILTSTHFRFAAQNLVFLATQTRLLRGQLLTLLLHSGRHVPQLLHLLGSISPGSVPRTQASRL